MQSLGVLRLRIRALGPFGTPHHRPQNAFLKIMIIIRKFRSSKDNNKFRKLKQTNKHKNDIEILSP